MVTADCSGGWGAPPVFACALATLVMPSAGFGFCGTENVLRAIKTVGLAMCIHGVSNLSRQVISLGSGVRRAGGERRAAPAGVAGTATDAGTAAAGEASLDLS